MTDKWQLTVKCIQCGKQARLKVTFPHMEDITHLVEAVMELEKKGWQCIVSRSNYGITQFYTKPRCEACHKASGRRR